MLNLTYTIISKPSETNVSYEIKDNSKNVVGWAEGYLNEYGELISVIKIKDDFQKKGIGFAAFKKVFDELNNKKPIETIISSWSAGEEFSYCERGMSTNLRLFIDCISKNQPAKECAFQTPTGKWALKLGFTDCRILNVVTDNVSVAYSREQNRR